MTERYRQSVVTRVTFTGRNGEFSTEVNTDEYIEVSSLYPEERLLEMRQKLKEMTQAAQCDYVQASSVEVVLGSRLYRYNEENNTWVSNIE